MAERRSIALVPAGELVRAARAAGYAVPHLNLNNLESLRAFLLAAQAERSPVILAVSGRMADYMGGHKTIAAWVAPFAASLGVDVPVALHVDHGTYEDVLSGLEAGFTSVMFDGSALPFDENLALSADLVGRCRARGVSLECEVGAIGGEEDGVTSEGELADPAQCARLAELGIDMLAAGIGNVHGSYPAGWQGLRLDVLAEIAVATGGLPLVLHGGSGIPEPMVEAAIAGGVAKVNVNTECQLAFAGAVRNYVEGGGDLRGKGYAVRAVLAGAVDAMLEVAASKMRLFGSAGRA